MRTPKLATPPIIKAQPDPEMITQERTYKVITALYGGGVEPGKADEITVVRVPEIRGQLRFWWRACRAAGYKDSQSLRERENLIWGSTEHPSALSIYCQVTNAGQPETAYTVVSNPKNGKPKLQESTKLPKYASFPLQPDKTEGNQIGWESETVLMNVSFTLQLQYPKGIEKEVKAALWAWETFGGIGARTRRGFGAIKCTEPATTLSSTVNEAKQQIQAYLNDPDYVSVGIGNPDIPKLSPKMKFKVVGGGEAKDSWFYLINKLNQFRQARFGKFGLSQWPEANAIRELNKRSLKSAKTTTGAARDPVHVTKYPRAVFGLPIIFHLPHDKLDDHSLEVSKHEGSKHDRLASPLILRPLLCKDGKAVGLAAVLDTNMAPPHGIELHGKDKQPVLSTLTPNEAKYILPLNGNPDVLEAFFNTL